MVMTEGEEPSPVEKAKQAERLLQKNIRIKLKAAIDEQKVDQIAVLMKKIDEMNAKDFEFNSYFMTPLHYATCSNKIESVKAILEFAVDLETRDRDNDTPLIDASWRGYHQILEMLITAGADINAQGSSGKTGLCRALTSDDISKVSSVVKVLCAHNADVYIKDEQQMTALDFLEEEKITPQLKKFFYKNGLIDPWFKENKMEVSFSEYKGDFKLTRFFNFKSMECVSFAESCKTNSQSHMIESFEKMAQKKIVLEAAKHLIDQGGEIPPSVLKKIQGYTGQNLRMKPIQKTRKT